MLLNSMLNSESSETKSMKQWRCDSRWMSMLKIEMTTQDKILREVEKRWSSEASNGGMGRSKEQEDGKGEECGKWGAGPLL